MKTTLLFSGMTLLATALIAADASPKNDIIAAAKKLGDKANYSWKTTVQVPEGSRYRPGPTQGKTEKNGLTHVTLTFGDNSVQAVLKGDEAVVTNREGDWQPV